MPGDSKFFWEVLFLFLLLLGRNQRRLISELFISFFVFAAALATAMDRVGGLEYLVVDSRTFGVLYHSRGVAYTP